MSDTKHTPGPWTVLETAHDLCIRAESEFVTVAEMLKSDIGDDAEALETARADARLIAAAPDLLAACSIAVDCLNMIAKEGEAFDPIIGFATVEKLRAAIVKAEGR